MGAFASFTLGAEGPQGGFGLELGRPAEQQIYIGLESAQHDTFAFLPFCDPPKGKVPAGLDDFGRVRKKPLRTYRHIPKSKIRRELTAATDSWSADELTFRIHSPVEPCPDPAKATGAELMRAYVPAITAELIIDNRNCNEARRFCFGFQEDRGSRTIRKLFESRRDAGLAGIAYGSDFAIVTDTPGVFAEQGFSVDEIFQEKEPGTVAFGLGRVGLMVGIVPPGKKISVRFALCFHRSGENTTGRQTTYLYRRFFEDLASVGRYALKEFASLHARGRQFDDRLIGSALSAEQRFMLAQAIHSYYGSTELVEDGDGPWWIVNEGEYRMMNTLDLSVDHLWFEAQMNPWTTRNVLDRHLQYYSYQDKVRLPGDSQLYPGGISFTHDIGVANHFSPAGRSAYEKTGTSDTFSSMTHEELLNWAICALVISKDPGHQAWAERQLPVLKKILTSLINRDHPDPGQRNGIMGADSSRCAGQSEITTYDSLDPALMQARGSVYLGVKTWGTYVGLADAFERQGELRAAARARHQAQLAAASIVGAAREDGILPALMGDNGPSLVIPAIEGLIVPHQLGLTEALDEAGPYGSLITTLRIHLKTLLARQESRFPDGGWRISSTSDNSWLSKIYLSQFIAGEILQAVSKAELKRADRAHADWSLDERNAYWAWSDQIVNGVAIGSKYYPRGVTAILWLTQP